MRNTYFITTNIESEMIRKFTTALIKFPIMILPMVIELKSGFPNRVAITGIIISFTSEFTTALKATPMMIPTAKSIILPCNAKRQA